MSETIIPLSGALNYQTTTAIYRRLHDVLKSKTLQALGMDFSAISYADSAGLALVIECIRECQQAGVSLRLIAIPRQMQKLATFSGIDTLLSQYQE